tara:strand:+ start:7941 stop:10490 length:2550 start_codon:yes stop_codon:yes gene_type:complete
MSLVKAKVSSVVSRQLPEFVREDHAQFVSFLEAYYEFMQQYEKRDLESTRDIDTTLDSFVQYFRNELLSQIPQNILSDKRYLAKQIQEVYRSKGTIKSYEFLFRILFNETPELYFPKIDMLRVSDGKWDQKSIIRTTEVSGDAFNLVGQTIRQGTTRASVESVIKFQVGTEEITELTLNEASIVGVFVTGESVTGLDNTDDSTVTLLMKSVVADFTIINDGAYYSVGSPITLISGTGTDAQAEVTNIGYGSISSIIVDTPGSGYTVGSELTFDNTDSGDSGSSLVSARAIITDIDIDSLLLEDGSKILAETRDQIDIETATTGGIKSIQIINPGAYYRKLPIVSATGGTGAKIIAVGPEIGRVTNVGVTNPGVGYDTAPIAVFPTNFVVKNISGTFAIGDSITVLTQTLALDADGDDELLLETGDKVILESQQDPYGTIYQFDIDRNLFVMYPSSDRIVLVNENGTGALLDEEGKTFVNEISGEFASNQTITNSSGATAKIISSSSDDHAAASGVIGALGRPLGKFINADGKVSDSSKKIQDSLFYQEYSYVIKVGQSIDKYRDVVKKLLHPIGLALFGEVRIQTSIQAPVNVTLQVSDLLTTIRLLIDMKMRAVGNYRSVFEDNTALDKEQITLIITDFISSALSLVTTTSEFLPTLNLPNLTPAEVHLLDLRAAVGESYKDIIIALQGSTPSAIAESYKAMIVQGIQSEGTRKLGPNLGWLEKWKFTIPPYETGSKDGINTFTVAWDQNYTGSSNQGYWNSFGNTQIKDFANVTVYDVINNSNRRTNYAQEAYINIIKLDVTHTMDSGDESMDSGILTMDNSDTFGTLFDTIGDPTLDATSITMDTM